MSGRGEITQEIKDKSIEVFGYEIGKTAMRLIPYILFALPNGGNGEAKLERNKINDEDKYWLKRWTDEGRILWSPPYIAVTKDFYMAACELQWMAYIKGTEVKQ